MTDEPDEIAWHVRADVLGVHVRAHFEPQLSTDSGATASSAGTSIAVLPGVALKSLREPGISGYVVGDLQACPDAVLEHGGGLISLSQRNGERELHNEQNWRTRLRPDAMLQCIVTAMAVSGHTQRPTVPMLRVANALYQFAPSPAVLECLASHIAAARQYAGEPGRIGAQQLASYCEPRVRALPVARGDVPSSQAADFADTVPSATAVLTR